MEGPRVRSPYATSSSSSPPHCAATSSSDARMEGPRPCTPKSQNVCTIRPLVTVMCFHQLSEGMGLGGCILQAKYVARMKAGLVFFFSTTTPFGIALELALTKMYRENSPTTLIVVGLFVYPIVKKGLPKKIREVTDCYFLPRRSWPSALTTYGVVCAASFGAGMLLEVWINKRSKVYSCIS
ncbi:hypothetical protein ZEAMMB73_Zm00001d013525 [Zea mays]|uniref:Uncharacterized protein n=1 Tax=Zea mays TaxID=4577 RepID=A0A1D6GK97_MAIZE|nr:hypothetical protein ZEAMMB73_Zm00001d013525 [Zea mays]